MKKIVHSKKVPRLLVADTGQTKRMPEITPEFLRSQGFSPTMPARFWQKVNKTEGCWLWTACKNSHGYGQIVPGKIGSNKPFTSNVGAHVVSWILHYGPFKKGLCVLHKCDVRCCVNPAHLWLGTHDENVFDAIKKDRMPFGEKHGGARLTEENIREIRRIRKCGVGYREVARRFRISKASVHKIWARMLWRRVN